MPIDNGFPDYRAVAGSRRLAEHLGALAAEVTRQSEVTSAAGGEVSASGIALPPPPPDRLMAKITGKDASTPPKYSWTLLSEVDGGTTTDDSFGVTGGASFFPACELSQNASVPVDGSAVVELRPAEAGEFFWFKWDPQAAAAAGVTARELDGSPSYAGVTTLTFDQADGFVVSQPAAGEARVDLAAASATQAGVIVVTPAYTVQRCGQGVKSFDEVWVGPTGYGLVDAVTGGVSREALWGNATGINDQLAPQGGPSLYYAYYSDWQAGTSTRAWVTFFAVGNVTHSVAPPDGVGLEECLGLLGRSGQHARYGVVYQDGGADKSAYGKYGTAKHNPDVKGGIVAGLGNDHATFTEIAAPSAPAAGTVAVYAKADGKLYAKDDAGTEYDLTASGGSSGITSLNGLTGSSQTFADADDTNVTLSVSSSGTTHTFTVGWSGSLAHGRGGTGLTATPTNGQLLIGNGAGYTLATLTAGSGVTITNGAGTVTIAASSSGITELNGLTAAAQTFGTANDTNVTLSVSSLTSTHTLTLGWQGTLSLARGGTGAGLSAPAGDRILFYDASAGQSAWLEAGSNLSISGTTLSATGVPDYVKVSDQKSSGTNGGSFTSGVWQTRELNTEDSDAAGHASVAFNQVTLAAGTWVCRVEAPAFNCDRHQARLYNATDTAVVTGTAGTNEFADNAGTAVTRSVVTGRFTLFAPKALEVQHRCSVSAASNGLGVAHSWGTEVYTVAEFWRVGS